MKMNDNQHFYSAISIDGNTSQLKVYADKVTVSVTTKCPVCHEHNDISGLTEKQKNCPYCHKPYKPFNSTGVGPVDGFGFRQYVNVSNVLGEGLINEPTLEVINVLKVPNCPFCGRKLNEEDSNEN